MQKVGRREGCGGSREGGEVKTIWGAKEEGRRKGRRRWK